MSTVLVLNGPNLDRLGTREPGIYGNFSLDDVQREMSALGESLGYSIDLRQTNDEAELIKWLHEAADSSTPVIMNPAAFTHTSVALRDAAAMLTAPLIEVHISNPLAREEFRHTSFISGVARGTIAGFGLNSYTLALRALADL